MLRCINDGALLALSAFLLTPPPPARSLSSSSPLIESLSLPPVHSGNECLSCKFPSDLWNECQKQRLQLCFLTKGSLLFQERLVVLLPASLPLTYPPSLPPRRLTPLPSHSRCLIRVSSPGLLFAERFVSSWDTGVWMFHPAACIFTKAYYACDKACGCTHRKYWLSYQAAAGARERVTGGWQKKPKKNGSSSLEKYQNRERCRAQSVFFLIMQEDSGGPGGVCSAS